MNAPLMTPVSTRVMNLAHFATQSAQRLPDHPAWIEGDTVLSWRDLTTRAWALARVLARDFGIAKGDRVLMQAPNCHHVLEIMLACFRLGAVWVPANFRGLPGDLEWQAELSGARGLICHAGFPEHAAKCAPRLEFVLSIGPSGFGPDIDDLIEARLGQSPPEAAVGRDDPAWFFFTSGTTGRPKASVLTHGQLAFVVTNHLADLVPGMTERDTAIVVAPLTHGAGIHAMLAMARGAASVLPQSAGFDPAEVWRLVERHRVSNMFTVPTILKMLVEDPAVEHFDHASLRHVIYAGAPMYRADQVTALRRLGPVLVQYFGLGEVTGNITVLRPDLHDAESDARPGTCGYARTGMEIQIQDDAGGTLAPGETGEICVAGPAVFAGYWNNPEANAAAFRDGWFRTGDVGHMDGEGFLHITGRASDMYISGGSNIHPREIEEKIIDHPAVSEAAVFGIPDPKWGEIGIAVCVPAPGAKIGEAAMRAHLEPRIARYKMPRRFVFWDALPKSGYGKITKKMVREAFFARHGRDGE